MNAFSPAFDMREYGNWKNLGKQISSDLRLKKKKHWTDKPSLNRKTSIEYTNNHWIDQLSLYKTIIEEAIIEQTIIIQMNHHWTGKRSLNRQAIIEQTSHHWTDKPSLNSRIIIEKKNYHWKDKP
jgi:hypothetical protein